MGLRPIQRGNTGLRTCGYHKVVTSMRQVVVEQPVRAREDLSTRHELICCWQRFQVLASSRKVTSGVIGIGIHHPVRKAALDYYDPDYEVLITLRAVKPEFGRGAPAGSGSESASGG
jgi:hypothetical protein